MKRSLGLVVKVEVLNDVAAVKTVAEYRIPNDSCGTYINTGVELFYSDSEEPSFSTGLSDTLAKNYEITDHQQINFQADPSFLNSKIATLETAMQETSTDNARQYNKISTNRQTIYNQTCRIAASNTATQKLRSYLVGVKDKIPDDIYSVLKSYTDTIHAVTNLEES